MLISSSNNKTQVVWQSRMSRFAIEQLIADVGWSGLADLQSLADIVYGEDFLGGNYVIHGGYVEMINAMAEGLDVVLQTPVSTVLWNTAGIMVETNDGVWTGSHVIVTVPLGVLKSGRPDFSPGLPAWKSDAIDRMDMGNVEKVVLRFDDAFWRNAPDSKQEFLWLAVS